MSKFIESEHPRGEHTGKWIGKLSNKMGVDLGERHIEPGRGKPSDDDYDNLKAYSGDGESDDVNPFLRGDTPEYADLDNPDEVQHIKDIVQSMDRVAATHNAKTDFKTYRTAPFGDVKVGDVIQDKAFVSTTTIKGMTARYVNKNDKMMEISVTKGQSVIPHNELSRHSGAKGEVILPRGSRIKVTGITPDGMIQGELQ
jgi:hypothetical protein